MRRTCVRYWFRSLPDVARPNTLGEFIHMVSHRKSLGDIEQVIILPYAYRTSKTHIKHGLKLDTGEYSICIEEREQALTDPQIKTRKEFINYMERGVEQVADFLARQQCSVWVPSYPYNTWLMQDVL